MRYDLALKNARMQVTLDRMSGGTLEVGDAGFKTVLAKFPLDSGEVVDAELVFNGMPKRAPAVSAGDGVEARCLDAAGVVCVTGLTVGDEASQADVIIFPDAQIKNKQTVELMGFRFVHG